MSEPKIPGKDYWYEIRDTVWGNIVARNLNTRHDAYDELEDLRETFPHVKLIAVRVEKI